MAVTDCSSPLGMTLRGEGMTRTAEASAIAASCLAADAILVAVQSVGIGRYHTEVFLRDVAVVEGDRRARALAADVKKT